MVLPRVLIYFPDEHVQEIPTDNRVGVVLQNFYFRTIMMMCFDSAGECYRRVSSYRTFVNCIGLYILMFTLHVTKRCKMLLVDDICFVSSVLMCILFKYSLTRYLQTFHLNNH